MVLVVPGFVPGMAVHLAIDNVTDYHCLDLDRAHGIFSPTAGIGRQRRAILHLFSGRQRPVLGAGAPDLTATRPRRLAAGPSEAPASALAPFVVLRGSGLGQGHP